MPKAKHRHVRAHFTRDGRRKQAFANQAAAEAHIGSQPGYSAYKCNWPGCGKWHIGRGGH